MFNNYLVEFLGTCFFVFIIISLSSFSINLIFETEQISSIIVSILILLNSINFLNLKKFLYKILFFPKIISSADAAQLLHSQGPSLDKHEK